MSEIKSFSDYTSKYNSNVDFSALFSGTSDSSSVGNTNMLSDYAAIKNGSYGKLMKAYYAKQDAEKLSGKGDTSQKLTLMKTSADSLKKSADALNDSSLWEKKKKKKKDEKTLAECRKEEATYYEQAYEGFLKAIASENFPMCGMEESTVNLLMANIAYKLGKVDIASRFISMILTSQAASRVAKDRAMLLKEEIIAKLHGKG